MKLKDKISHVNFARHCMMQLLTNPPVNPTGYPEISSYDLYRIEKIISKYVK